MLRSRTVKMEKNSLLAAMYDGKLMGDFLLVITELFSLGAFVLAPYTRLTDRQTDRRTDGQTES